MKIERDLLIPLAAVLLGAFSPIICLCGLKGGWRSALEVFRGAGAILGAISAWLLTVSIALWLFGRFRDKRILSKRMKESERKSPSQVSDPLLDEVLSFVAERSGASINELSIGVRLAQDLGIDGDDAGEFFDEFQRKFKVNLIDLSRHWNRHFGPEGWSGPTPPGFPLVLAGIAIIFFLLAKPFGIYLALVICTLLFAASLWVYHALQAHIGHGQGQTCIPITIGDLAESVRAGKWIIPYPES